jgi:glycosyltransferase involved in cell wall biosynthesis
MFFGFLKSILRRAMAGLAPSYIARKTAISDKELLQASIFFDADFYLVTYPDVALAGVDPVDHYLRHGGLEGRQPSTRFDGAAYLRENEDVKRVGVNPLVHFLRHGQAEGRGAMPCAPIVEDMATWSDVEASEAAPAKTLLSDDDRPRDARRIIEESGLWDAEFYCRIYPDIDPKQMDPLDHYVNHGGREGRRPHPLFDGPWYTSEYPDVLESGMHPLVHYITIGKKEGRLASIDPRIIQTAADTIAQAGAIEPAILLDPALAKPDQLRISFGGQGWPGLRVWQKLFDSLEHAYTHVVFVPWLVRGGADLAAANAVKAAIEVHGKDSTLVVLADYDRADAVDWLPDGAHTRILSEFGPTLNRSDRVFIIELLIRTIRPKAVLNVNSGACWDAIVQRGGGLSRVTDLYACLFCRDFAPDGRAAGYADSHFRDGLKYLKKVYFDNERFLLELTADYGVPQPLRARLSTLHQPIDSHAGTKHSGGPTPRNQVMWAGRFCAQKNVDLLIEIAEKAASLTFDIYGYGDDVYMGKLQDAAERLPNVLLKGGFSATSKLPINNYNAFLYTSLWDGLPLTLADLAGMGIPVVASAVGGIPDLVRPDTGWLIEAYTEPESYILALNEICENPRESASRSEKMIELVKSEHSWHQFVKSLQVSPSFLD